MAESKKPTGLRIIRWSVVGCLLLIILLSSMVLIPPLFNPTGGFIHRKGNLQRVEIIRQWNRQGEQFNSVMLFSDNGLAVELTYRKPEDSIKPRPLVLLLGGYRTGQAAAELIRNTQGAIVAALSYPAYAREMKDNSNIYQKTRAIQQTILDTGPAILLALDYLAGQPFVDKQHMELAGVSLGAFLVTAPAAMDNRVSRVWLIHGGGKPEEIFAYHLQEFFASAVMHELVARLVAYLTYSYHLNPETWVARISPRPVIVVNAKNDRSFPPGSVAALHRSLQQPYEIIWMGEQHIQASQQNIIDQIASMMCNRIIADAER